MSKKSPSNSKHRQPKDIDSYLSSIPDECRKALQKIREAVQATAPDAEEAFVYGVPGFKLRGRPLVCYTSFKHHCGFYPMSPAVIRAHAADLNDYYTSEGTIRFTADKPLSLSLVKKLVKTRMAESQK